MVTDEILKLREQAIELSRIRREEEALELFERAAESGDYLSNIHIARYWLSRRNSDEAQEYLNRVIAAYNSASQPVEDALLIEAAAEAYYLSGDINSDNYAPILAKLDWENAIRLGCVKAYYRLGYLHYNKGIEYLDKALECWKKGVEAGDERCIEPYNEHLNEDTEEPIYEGERDENGLPHGQGVMYYPKESLQLWSGFMVAPKCYEGEWCHGVKSGKGQMLYYTEYKSSRISYRGDWKEDMPEGTGRVCEYYRSVSKREFIEQNSYEGGWVAGTREGFGVENLRDGSSYMGYWAEDKRQGKGLMSTPEGKSFHGVWSDGYLDRSSCYLENTPSLNITLNHAGLDYNRTAFYLLPCKVGSYQLTDGVNLMSDSGFNDSEPLIEILVVEDGVVRYRVDGKYSNDKAPIEGTITKGQSVVHRSAMDAVDTIYDDDHHYEIVCEIEIKYNN